MVPQRAGELPDTWIAKKQNRFDGKEAKMKRRIETQMEWDFTKCGSSKGLPTNLPITSKSKEPAPVYLRAISVRSSNGSTEGRVHVQFDRNFGGDYRGPCPLEHAVIGLCGKLYDDHLTTGSNGIGPDGFSTEFELSRRQNSFCHQAVGCVVEVILRLGIQRSEIFYPDVSQKTFVWIPKTRTPYDDPNFWGWIEYGKWLGSQCRLKDRFSDKPLPELRQPVSRL